MQIKELTTQREETLTALNKAEENIGELENEVDEMKVRKCKGRGCASH